MKDLLDQLNPSLRKLVAQLGSEAEAKGLKAYLVGGPVRDLILGKPNIDLDIAIEGNAIKLAEFFARKFKAAKPIVYPAFGTSTVKLADGTQIDFAMARKETYSKSGAFPKVTPSTIKEDLQRRDFTINAMALGINSKTWGKLIDPFAGQADLKAKKIRILHNQSFVDDPTRILRAARFKARLGFSIEAQTLKLLKSAIQMKVLDTIKPQRYRKDFDKILKEPQSFEAIKILTSWKALPTWGHDFSRVPKQVAEQTKGNNRSTNKGSV